MVVRLRVLCDGDKVNGPTLCLVRSVAEPWDDFAAAMSKRPPPVARGTYYGARRALNAECSITSVWTVDIGSGVGVYVM